MKLADLRPQVMTASEVFGGPVGTCRYNPPVLDCTWPIVLETDWCGNYDLDANPPAGAMGQCLSCRYFSDGKILGQHPAVPA